MRNALHSQDPILRSIVPGSVHGGCGGLKRTRNWKMRQEGFECEVCGKRAQRQNLHAGTFPVKRREAERSLAIDPPFSNSSATASGRDSGHCATPPRPDVPETE